MFIVPRNDDLIIETRIKPVDVDVIEVGLLAEVRFTAFKQRTTPALSGEVVYVSADILTDPELEEAFFIARTGRPGPVLIDVPKDVQLATQDEEPDYDPIPPGYRVIQLDGEEYHTHVVRLAELKYPVAADD